MGGTKEHGWRLRGWNGSVRAPALPHLPELPVQRAACVGQGWSKLGPSEHLPQPWDKHRRDHRLWSSHTFWDEFLGIALPDLLHNLGGPQVNWCPKNPTAHRGGEGSTSPVWERQSLQWKRIVWEFLTRTQNLHILYHRTTE